MLFLEWFSFISSRQYFVLHSFCYMSPRCNRLNRLQTDGSSTHDSHPPTHTHTFTNTPDAKDKKKVTAHRTTHGKWHVADGREYIERPKAKGTQRAQANSTDCRHKYIASRTQNYIRCLRQKEGKTSQGHTMPVACGRQGREWRVKIKNIGQT